jgi:UDP-xylose/UDP-N-acetylglucosamine transporter B4
MLNDNDASKRGHEYPINRSRVSTLNTDKIADLVSSHSWDKVDYAQLKKDAPGLVAAAAHAVVPSWTNMAMMVSLIFGGCCANVRYFKLRWNETNVYLGLCTGSDYQVSQIFQLLQQLLTNQQRTTNSR